MNEDFPIGTRVQDIDDIHENYEIVGTVVERPQTYRDDVYKDHLYVLWDGNGFVMWIRPKYLVKV